MGRPSLFGLGLQQGALKVARMSDEMEIRLKCLGANVREDENAF